MKIRVRVVDGVQRAVLPNGDVDWMLEHAVMLARDNRRREVRKLVNRMVHRDGFRGAAWRPEVERRFSAILDGMAHPAQLMARW